MSLSAELGDASLTSEFILFSRSNRVRLPTPIALGMYLTDLDSSSPSPFWKPQSQSRESTPKKTGRDPSIVVGAAYSHADILKFDALYAGENPGHNAPAYLDVETYLAPLLGPKHLRPRIRIRSEVQQPRLRRDPHPVRPLLRPSRITSTSCRIQTMTGRQTRKRT